MKKSRRKFIKSSLLVPPFLLSMPGYALQKKAANLPKSSKIKLSLNAYSFNKPLRDGSMDLDELLKFTASLNFDGIDLTAYYFPGYPNVPEKKYLFEIKRKAFLSGLSISGTGIRTDFTITDPDKQKAQFEYIASWIEAAAILGTPVIRVFAGKKPVDPNSWNDLSDQVVKGLKQCCNIGASHGVMIALQNHNEFIKTADQCLDIYQRVNSPWLGLMVDIGSLRTGNPYPEIEKLAPYAVTWQLKENVYVSEEPQPTDISKIINILRSTGYRGFLPIETLGEGDPETKVRNLFTQVNSLL